MSNTQNMKTSIIATVGLALLSVSAEAQHVLTRENTLMRPGDAISKQQIAFVVPGESGEDVVWDFRDVPVRRKNYRVEYTGNNASALLSIHPGYMSRYRMAGDTLVQTGYENPTARLTYRRAIPELVFPFAYGDTIASEFEGNGLYCRHNGMKERGTVLVEADATGTLLLSEEDTLRNVLRVHAIRTSSVDMDRDSVVADSAGRLLRIEENYKWFARGYRYPIFETLTEAYYHGTQYVYGHRTAYRTMPDSIRALADAVNEDIIHSDSISNAFHGSEIIQYHVSHYGNAVRVDYSLSMQATVTALISDAMGVVHRRYHHTDNSGDSYSFSFDMSGLRRGEYVLYLNANGEIHSQTIYNR